MNWRKNRLSTVDEVGEHQFDVSSDDDELMNPFDDVREQFELLKTVRRNVLKSIDEETEVKFFNLRKKANQFNRQKKPSWQEKRKRQRKLDWPKLPDTKRKNIENKSNSTDKPNWRDWLKWPGTRRKKLDWPKFPDRKSKNVEGS